MKKKIFITLPFLFLLTGVLFNIISYASVGTMGGELYTLTQETAKLEHENSLMDETLAAKQSLSGIHAQATDLGFVPVSRLVVVEVKDSKLAIDVTTTK